MPRHMGVGVYWPCPFSSRAPSRVIYLGARRRRSSRPRSSVSSIHGPAPPWSWRLEEPCRQQCRGLVAVVECAAKKGATIIGGASPRALAQRPVAMRCQAAYFGHQADYSDTSNSRASCRLSHPTEGPRLGARPHGFRGRPAQPERTEVGFYCSTRETGSPRSSPRKVNRSRAGPDHPALYRNRLFPHCRREVCQAERMRL